MDDLRNLVLLTVIVASLLVIFRKPTAVFVVRIRDGRPEAVQGTVTPAFLAAVQEISAEQHVQAGEVRGVQRGSRISLWFSGRLPEGFCQRLRNWWAMSGWPARSQRR